MCGRFFLDSQAGEIIEHYNAPPPDFFTARYNIAPTTPVLAMTSKGANLFRWGLVPSWAKDLSMGNRMFNARAETIAEKPSFKNAYRRRRCLIPANGYYEWRSEQGIKQPYCCHIDHALFSMAGIWELWQDSDGNELQSCAVITTEAKGAISQIHHRMPVHIDVNNYDQWLDCKNEQSTPDQLLFPDSENYEFYPVNTMVNNSRNEGADLIQPMNPA